MNKNRFLELLEKQARGLTSPEEERLISEVYDQMQLKRADWDMNSAEEAETKQKIKELINQRLFQRRISYRRTVSFYVRVAASLLLVCGFSYLYFFKSQVEIQPQVLERVTNERQKATITLMDGTLVHLNVNSRICFPEEFTDGVRKVKLDGEAFFEVMSDASRPFLVESGGVTTTVLGTSFNVNAYGGKDIEVAVKTGKVRVSQDSDDENRLTVHPNQKVTIEHHSNDFFIEEVDMEDYLLWRQENIAFDLVYFDEAVRRLAKAYNVNIVLEGFKEGECMIRARYSNTSLHAVLYGLKNLVDFEYEEKDEGNIVIYYKGCKD